MDLIQQLNQTKMIAIMRGMAPYKVMPVAQALVEGGIEYIELTMDSELAAEGIAMLRETFPDLYVGAGTVTNKQIALEAAAAGAQYLISPNVNTQVMDVALQQGIPICPGAMTPTEIVTAWEYGAQAVKLFPAGVLGVDYFQAVRSPLKQIPLIATGGINANNAANYIKAGACAVGVGGNLFDPVVIENAQYDIITKRSKQYISLLQEFT